MPVLCMTMHSAANARTTPETSASTSLPRCLRNLSVSNPMRNMTPPLIGALVLGGTRTSEVHAVITQTFGGMISRRAGTAATRDSERGGNDAAAGGGKEARAPGREGQAEPEGPGTQRGHR